MPASLAEQLAQAWLSAQRMDLVLDWPNLPSEERRVWEAVAAVARDLCQSAVVGFRCVCGIDHAFETREVAIERLTAERDELLAYIDAAKRAAGDRRVSGEPLASFIERLVAEADGEAWK